MRSLFFSSTMKVLGIGLGPSGYELKASPPQTISLVLLNFHVLQKGHALIVDPKPVSIIIIKIL